MHVHACMRACVHAGGACVRTRVSLTTSDLRYLMSVCVYVLLTCLHRHARLRMMIACHMIYGVYAVC